VTFELRLVYRDGVPTQDLKCPGCGRWGEIEDDQFFGRVSVFHDIPGCGWHETHNISKDCKLVEGRASKAFTAESTL